MVVALLVCLVLGTVTATAFTSGYLYHAFGWAAVNLGVVGPLAVAALAILWLGRHRRLAMAA